MRALRLPVLVECAGGPTDLPALDGGRFQHLNATCRQLQSFKSLTTYNDHSFIHSFVHLCVELGIFHVLTDEQ